MLAKKADTIRILLLTFGQKSGFLDDLIQKINNVKSAAFDLSYIHDQSQYQSELTKARNHLILGYYKNGGGFDIMNALDLKSSANEPPPFIVIATDNDPNKIERCFEKGASDFLTPSDIHKAIPAIMRETQHYRQTQGFKGNKLSEQLNNLKFNHIFENHQSVMLVINAQSGNIFDANRAAKNFYGDHIQSLKDTSIQDLTIDPAPNLLEELSDNSTGDRSKLLRQKTVKGIRHVELYATYITGYVDYLFTIIHDVTEKHANQIKLSQTLEKLEIRNEELDNFNYKVSHDLRAPLCSVRGLLNIVKLGVSEEEFPEYLQLIESRVNKLDNFILDVLSHSKNIHAPVELTMLNLEALVQEALDELQYLKNHSRLKVEVTSNGSFIVESDRIRLSNIVKNIISNSIHFLDPYKADNWLKISVLHHPKHVELHFSDNGVGISESIQPLVFNMFYRGHESSENSGIGLYIVKRAVEKLNGKVTLESDALQGTSLKIKLPRYKQLSDVNVV